MFATSQLSKILDSIVAKQLQWMASRILTVHQHGFCKNKSTLSNLLEYYSYLNDAFANRNQVDTIYTDFAKAFDRVDHNVLILKLTSMGFRQNTIDWLTSFLTGKWQQVKIGNYLSDPFKVTSGVPQGSHCGPILFLLFINDFSYCFKYSKFLLFADDLKVFKEIITPIDCHELQTDLNNTSQKGCN